MMEFSDFCTIIREKYPDIVIKENEMLSKHTSFKIGGPARIMVFPHTTEALQFVLKLCAQMDFKPRILGAGTNVLAPDEGIDQPVICLKDALIGMQLLNNNRIRVYSGVTMARAAVFAANNGLGGMEFAHGIPGTVGGGVYMNAGAYGGEIADICERVTLLTDDCSIVEVPASSLEFAYRHSILEKSGHIVISAVFQLYPKAEAEVRAYMAELIGRRRNSQPLDMPSAGSAFKRPATGYAAALIDQSGLRGFQVGGAAVSTKHTGFVVNAGGATARDVTDLLDRVSDIVFDKFGVRLEPEVRIW